MLTGNQQTETKIQRYINIKQECELIGFCDASQQAYGAVIYVRTQDSFQLLIAKSRVTPLKQQLTIPKAELAGAALLSEWTNTVFKWMNVQNCNYYLFTDSTAVL